MVMTRFDPIDPIEALTPLREAMNRLTAQSFLGAQFDFLPAMRSFPIDVYETEDAYTIAAAVPGIQPEAFQVTVTGNMLTIHAEIKAPEKPKAQGAYVRRERYMGEITRIIELPTVIRSDQVTATYDHGVLTLLAPKAEEAKPKQIAVQVKPPALKEAAPIH
jgi:HSP20 family protein